MRKSLPHSFFKQKTLVAARALIGMYLVRNIGGTIVRERITETEAYVGPHDLACHSAKGRTPRTEVMFADAGTIYVYLIYGMYYMLNIVTEACDYPSAILIRGTEHFKGPGVLTRELRINKKLNGKKFGKSPGLWFEYNDKDLPLSVISTPRIGVTYAGPIWSKKKYRFVAKEKAIERVRLTEARKKQKQH